MVKRVRVIRSRVLLGSFCADAANENSDGEARHGPHIADEVQVPVQKRKVTCLELMHGDEADMLWVFGAGSKYRS